MEIEFRASRVFSRALTERATFYAALWIYWFLNLGLSHFPKAKTMRQNFGIELAFKQGRF